MTYSKAQLDGIYDRTTGYCHLCHKKLARKNYAAFGSRGSWEVDHSNPQANGGTHHGNNLFAACISCNRAKGDSRTTAARSLNGKKRAPLSPVRREDAKFQNRMLGAVAGALVGAIFGPPGIIIGSIVCGYVAGTANPDKC